MAELKIYTDGACSGNPGTGGYAFAIISNDRLRLVSSGGELYTTNNRMELMAIIKAIESISFIYAGRKVNITILSDSAYCINSFTRGWVNFWKENGWKKKDGEEVKNSDLWKRLLSLIHTKKYKITFVKVKGHSGMKYNELVDAKAKEAIVRLNSIKSIQAEGGNKR